MNLKMKYRPFGLTGLQMPVLTCGGMRYHYKWQDLRPDEVPHAAQENLAKTLHRAFELGINHFETARGYGSSEMQMGQVLGDFPRDQIIVQTKVAPAKNRADFRRKFETSLQLLKLDRVDLLGIHGINNPETLDWSLRPGGALEEALKLKEEGLVGQVGFSSHGPVEILLAAINTGLFAYVNLHWYWVNPFTRPAVEAAKARQMGVLIISPNDKGGRLWDPPPSFRALTQPLEPMVFGGLFCLAHPGVNTLSIGAARPEDFEVHLKTVALIEQADELLAPILKRLEAVQLEALGPQWRGEWWQGIPPYETLPGQVNVAEILRLWVHAKAFGLVQWGQSRYNMLGHANHWFPGNPAVNFNESALRASLKNHPLQNEILPALTEAHHLLANPEKIAGPRNSGG